MAGRRILFGALVAALFLPPGVADAKTPRRAATADSECPLDANGRSDPACTTPSPELTKVRCPASLSDTDCDAYRAGYDDAREDRKIMGETERGQWFDDAGDAPAYKAGYKAGWKSR